MAKKTTRKPATKATGKVAKTLAISDYCPEPAAKPKGSKAKPAAKATIDAQPQPKAKGKKPAKANRPKRMSALDAAAKLLADAGEPMTCKALIEQMSAKGLWSSPNGKTPAATLYAAILREITTKGAKARFKKVDRGQFAAV